MEEREQVLEEVHTHAAASQLRCPSILKLLYAAEVAVDLTRWLPHAQRGTLRRHAFVMEYASGHRLQDVLANHEMIGTLARVEAGSGSGSGAGASPPPPRSSQTAGPTWRRTSATSFGSCWRRWRRCTRRASRTAT